MDDQETIELRPSASSLVAAYGFLAFISGGLALIGVTQANSVPLVLSFVTFVIGLSIVLKLTRRKALILDPQGIRLKGRGAGRMTPWADVRSVVLRRIPKAKGTEPAVLILRRDRTELKFRSHYAITPETLFETIDRYVKERSIPVSTDARSLDASWRNWLPEN